MMMEIRYFTQCREFGMEDKCEIQLQNNLRKSVKLEVIELIRVFFFALQDQQLGENELQNLLGKPALGDTYLINI